MTEEATAEAEAEAEAETAAMGKAEAEAVGRAWWDLSGEVVLTSRDEVKGGYAAER